MALKLQQVKLTALPLRYSKQNLVTKVGFSPFSLPFCHQRVSFLSSISLGTSSSFKFSITAGGYKNWYEFWWRYFIQNTCFCNTLRLQNTKVFQYNNILDLSLNYQKAVLLLLFEECTPPLQFHAILPQLSSSTSQERMDQNSLHQFNFNYPLLKGLCHS